MCTTVLFALWAISLALAGVVMLIGGHQQIAHDLSGAGGILGTAMLFSWLDGCKDSE